MHTDVLERFEAKFEPEPNSGCWLWTAHENGLGYGQFYYKGKPRGAHRVSYQLYVGEIPEGLVLDHLCRVTNCVNPDHLEPVTQKENLMRGVGIHKCIAYSKTRTMESRNMKGFLQASRDWHKKQREKTHCKHGHEFTEENTYRVKNNWRNCRRCAIDRATAFNKKKRLLKARLQGGGCNVA